MNEPFEMNLDTPDIISPDPETEIENSGITEGMIAQFIKDDEECLDEYNANPEEGYTFEIIPEKQKTFTKISSQGETVDIVGFRYKGTGRNVTSFLSLHGVVNGKKIGTVHAWNQKKG